MSSMEGCCKFIEKLNGELYGFIHSAGVLQDSMLMNLTWEKFETVFQSLGNRVSPCQTSGGNQTSLRCFPVFKILTVFYSPISPISPSQSPDVSRCLQMSPDVSRCLQMSPVLHGLLRSKHHAALFLHYALEQNPQKDFRFMWNFSSTSVYGNMGQLNYSGSNSFLDVLTRHRKVPQTRMRLQGWRLP